MIKKIALIYSGFQNFYLQKLISLFVKDGYSIDIYTNNRTLQNFPNCSNLYYFESQISEKNPQLIEKLNAELKELMKDKNYEHILSDCCPISFGCNVFHTHSLGYRKKMSPNFIYEFIFKITHFKKLNFFKKWHNSEHKKIFVVSNRMKQDYAKSLSIPEEKIAVLIPGINIEQIENPSKINLSKDEFVLGISAIGFSTKGGYFLLDAIRRIKNKNIKCKMIYPKYEKNFALKILIKIMGIENRIEFLHRQNNMSEFYDSIDCLVASSLIEAFGRVVTEAMVKKTPIIIGSNIGACDIIKDGENGFVYKFDKKSGKNLALKIEEVYEKRTNLNEVIENAYKTAETLSWDNFAEKMFKELVKQ